MGDPVRDDVLSDIAAWCETSLPVAGAVDVEALDFVELGGDSLAVVELSIHLEERWSVEVSPELIFEARNLREISELVTRQLVGQST
jgi:acyl carrier protein